MKVYHVQGSRHFAIVFSEEETEDEARRLAIESRQIPESDLYIVGGLDRRDTAGLTVTEYSLPEGWELRRRIGTSADLAEWRELVEYGRAKGEELAKKWGISIDDHDAIMQKIVELIEEDRQERREQTE